ncbi:hypothetical protein H6G00_00975 [Leptolyngbya sp. FACHB-541]|uniref:hypothetical protein n=1 Tax=Leptolyngbya sp. FACHB-541 TaxID=2692810 RepID=UPI001681CEA8|nr:hypothetical protein [Leptolyngbya sp. FACHB-541]MBD1995201.1 hypothetical protein [Leptolyngbya sp. FACHB-541]
MSLSNALPTEARPRVYVWTILICINETIGYGAFSTVMPYPPTKGNTIEFRDTPEGNFSGTIFDVEEVVKFQSCETEQLDPSFEIRKAIEVLPSAIQFRVFVEVKFSSELTKQGIPKL